MAGLNADAGTATGPSLSDMVALAGGVFRMGSDRFYPEEAPVRLVEVAAFRLDRRPVTNRDFDRFVKDTGYVTTAERVVEADSLPGVDTASVKPGALVFRPWKRAPPEMDWTQWWRYKPGAQWRRPNGVDSIFAGRLDHPVVCVSHEDAAAFARWAGKRLPREAEWELAARGGLDGADFAWGDAFMPDKRRMANTWIGVFPIEQGRSRGLRTSAVGTYPANGFGLVDMIGNVWEWTDDWYSFGNVAGEVARSCCGAPPASAFHDGDQISGAPHKVVKGGSFLCAPNHCARYRPAARQPQMIDTAAVHIGFRCAKDAE